MAPSGASTTAQISGAAWATKSVLEQYATSSGWPDGEPGTLPLRRQEWRLVWEVLLLWRELRCNAVISGFMSEAVRL